MTVSDFMNDGFTVMLVGSLHNIEDNNYAGL